MELRAGCTRLKSAVGLWKLLLFLLSFLLPSPKTFPSFSPLMRPSILNITVCLHLCLMACQMCSPFVLTLYLSCVSCGQPKHLFLKCPFNFSYKLELTSTRVKISQLNIFFCLLTCGTLLSVLWFTHTFGILNGKFKLARNKFILWVFIVNFWIPFSVFPTCI